MAGAGQDGDSQHPQGDRRPGDELPVGAAAVCSTRASRGLHLTGQAENHPSSQTLLLGAPQTGPRSARSVSNGVTGSSGQEPFLPHLSPLDACDHVQHSPGSCGPGPVGPWEMYYSVILCNLRKVLPG